MTVVKEPTDLREDIDQTTKKLELGISKSRELDQRIIALQKKSSNLLKFNADELQMLICILLDRIKDLEAYNRDLRNIGAEKNE
jgi:fructose-1,6-bisphosphatase